MALTVSRMDLDGAGSPNKLAVAIFKAEPNLTIPVPIVELSMKLDIVDIRDLTTEGFVGSLVTNTARTNGGILVNKYLHPHRRRFTIAHELGHFLMTHHRPPSGTTFLCSQEDLRRYDDNEQDKARKMEVEANQFAALILIPPQFLRQKMSTFRDPNLTQVLKLSDDFEVSKEAAARAYTQYHNDHIAIIHALDGVAKRIYRSRQFPRMCISIGDRIPQRSALFRERNNGDQPSTVIEGQSEFWLESNFGIRLPSLYEQVLHQRSGHAMIMLWAEKPEEDDHDEDENRTSKERFRARQDRWNR